MIHTCIILSCCEHGIFAKIGARDVQIRDENDIAEIAVSCPGLPIMFSSSMDFPEEHTNDKDIIALAHQLREASNPED